MTSANDETATVDGEGVLRQFDAVTVPVPSQAASLALYRDVLGHRVLWRNDQMRNDQTGQAAVELPDGDSDGAHDRASVRTELAGG